MKPATAPRCLRLACLISAAHPMVFPAFAQDRPTLILIGKAVAQPDLTVVAGAVADNVMTH